MLFLKLRKLLYSSESFFIKKKKIWRFRNIFLKTKYVKKK